MAFFQRMIIIAYVFAIAHTSINAQINKVHRIDSLIHTLKLHAKKDTAKANTLNELSKAYIVIHQYDSALYYATDAFKLADLLKYRKGVANSYRSIGNIKSIVSDTASAYSYYKAAYIISKQIQDKKSMFLNLRNLGILYWNDYTKAFSYLQYALAIAKQINDPEILTEAYTDMGNIFASIYNYSLAIDNFKKAIDINNKQVNRQAVLRLYLKMGSAYQNMNAFKEAMDKYEQAEQLGKELDDKSLIAMVLNAKGNLYINMQNTEKALTDYKQAIAINEALKDELTLGNSYANIAFVYQIMSDYKEAIVYHKKALEISNKIKNDYGKLLYKKDMGSLILYAPDSILKSIGINPQNRNQIAIEYEKEALKIAEEKKDDIQQIAVLNTLVQANATLGNYKDAYLQLYHLVLLNDSVSNIEKQKELVRNELKYTYEIKETAEKVKQEKKDSQERSIRNSLLAGLVTVMLFSGVFYQQRNKLKKEKNRSDNLLLNILPAQVADELKANGKAEAHRYDNISVLFTDFVNFTGASETLSPEEVVGELHTCFTAFDNIMEKNGLEKIKTIGDAYMAVCGLPQSKENHAQRTVQAALEIIEFMHQRNHIQKTFSIRIGINSGSVVAGIVGLKKFAYDIWGDTVNTAARMEQNGAAGKINISEDTYHLIKKDFECVYRGELEAKNKGKLKMYFITSSNNNSV